MLDHDFDLGSYRRSVTTASEDAGTWFDRGLMWAHVFNPEEAVRCFQRSVEFDPECAMAWWGIAYASGPNYNKAWIRFDQADLTATVEYVADVLSRAKEASSGASPVERALVDALTARFPSRPDSLGPEEFTRLNIAYAEAMREVYEAHPDDIDVAALFADALLCVSPRALWDLATGEPVGYGTVDAREVLEGALSRPEGRSTPRCRISTFI